MDDRDNRENATQSPEIIDVEYVDVTPEEGKSLCSTLASFVNSYSKKAEGVSDEEWLLAEFKTSMPEKTEQELTQMRDEIIDGLRSQEEAKASLDSAMSKGMSKENWFARECERACSGMSAMESAQYLQRLDDTVAKANEEMMATLIAKSTGMVSQNPHLDGFIAEQFHAQTFNMNAAAKGSPYRAKVLKPNGARYAKNSVDIVIIDTRTGKRVRRYQLKYGATPELTDKYYSNNYPGQQKLVPSDQAGKFPVNTSWSSKPPTGPPASPYLGARRPSFEMRPRVATGKTLIGTSMP